MEYLLHILILISIYAILSISLNLIAGYTGLLSMAHAAFFGVGAYVAALMALNIQTPFVLNIVCATIVSGLLGGLVGIPSLRIREDYFVIATFAVQVIAFSTLNNWVSFTGGPMGLPGIPSPVVFRWVVSSHLEFLFLTGFFCSLTLWFTRRIAYSPFGRVLIAIREDEVFASGAGKNVATFKVLVFIIGACMAGAAGCLYAYYMSFIDPTSFTVMDSIFIVTIMIVGGAGNIWGSLLGAALLVTVPEVLRFLDMPVNIAANMRQILYGAFLVACMMWRPQGLLGQYSFGKDGPRK